MNIRWHLQYYMQHIVMAGVMADAAMVDGAIERDVYCRRGTLRSF